MMTLTDASFPRQTRHRRFHFVPGRSSLPSRFFMTTHPHPEVQKGPPELFAAFVSNPFFSINSCSCDRPLLRKGTL